MIFHIAVCSPDAVLRGRVQRHCLEYYARRADACIVEQLEDAGALLREEDAGSRFELYLIELTAANPAAGLQAAAQLRQRGVRAPLAFLAHTPAYAYEAFRVDAMQYLQIPFRPEQLTALLDRSGNYQRKRTRYHTLDLQYGKDNAVWLGAVWRGSFGRLSGSPDGYDG